jgi:GTP-binding protein Era
MESGWFVSSDRVVARRANRGPLWFRAAERSDLDRSNPARPRTCGDGVSRGWTPGSCVSQLATGGYLQHVSRCGIVALAGAPNVGKSTLLNALVGESLAVTSPKPQTTRVPVRGLVTDAETQIVLVDPAGLMDPAYPLQRAMRRAAVDAIREADLVLHLHPLAEYPAPTLEALVRGGAPHSTGPVHQVLTVYTKADLVPAERRPQAPCSDADPGPSTCIVSAVTGEGLATLLAAIRARLPDGPFLYDAGDVGTQALRFFAAEYVRGAAFALLEQELPYCVAVEIDAFREAEEPVYIRATIAVERESQKPIVLGKGGRTIKAIGMAAREKLEVLLGRRARVELWVTVWPGWRRDASRLAQLGLPASPASSAKGRAP